jgi:hypothetical protein
VAKTRARAPGSYEKGYRDALSDLVSFAIERRTAPFEAIEDLAEAKRGKKSVRGQHTFETKLERAMLEFRTYYFVKHLVAKNYISLTSAYKEARDTWYPHAAVGTVKKIYQRLRKQEKDGKLLWKDEGRHLVWSDQERRIRERRFHQFINELNVNPAVYGKKGK